MDSLITRINEVFNDKKVRKTLLKLRLPLGIIFFIFLFFQTKRAWYFPGLVISVLGETFQVWCLSTIKTKKELTMVGPYMLLRNPMYIGRYFLIFGILMMTGNPWFLIIFTILYYFYMANRVKREEKVLLDFFGSDYEAYCRDVNRYMPGFKRYDKNLLKSFNKESIRQNNVLINVSVVLTCYAILFFKAFVWKPI